MGFEDAEGGGDDDEGWETEDEMEAEAQQDDSELTFSKHTGKSHPAGPSLGLCPGVTACLVSRLGVLRQPGPGHQQPGRDGRTGRQGVRVEGERRRGSAGVHG